MITFEYRTRWNHAGERRVDITFSDHARAKFAVLARHGVHLSEAQVRDTVSAPDHVEPSRKGRYVAQKGQTRTLVLRVIYRPTDDGVEVVTFYPGRRSRYES